MNMYLTQLQFRRNESPYYNTQLALHFTQPTVLTGVLYVQLQKNHPKRISQVVEGL